MTDASKKRPGARPANDRAARPVPWQRLLNRPTQYVLDLAVLAASFWLSYALRFEFAMPEIVVDSAFVQLPLVLLLQLGALQVFGVYSFVWRYVGMAEVAAFVKAALLSCLPLLALRLGLGQDFAQWRVPLSVILMTTVFGYGGVLALRVLRRALYERYEKGRRSREVGLDARRRRAVLLVGAGQAGVLAAKEIANRGDMNLDIRGFVDDDPGKQGTVIQGVKVIGTTRDLVHLVPELDIDHVVITIAQASRSDIRRIVAICESIPVRAQIIPGIYQILSGAVEISAIRDVEIEDLLGREAVKLDEDELRRFLAGSTVMVTGAGGSIGSELARQVARFGVGTLLLVERAEFVLFEIDRELRGSWPQLAIVPLVADVCDRQLMAELMARYRPSVVIHAAAHKHVPMMESNPTEAVKNNILATRSLGEVAGEAGVEAFIQISTDKAVRPTSVMGASKRAAELAIQDLNPRYPTRFVSVRFGNVLGSAGSVIPLFREQILKGGPVTVTHPDMVRYFMTIPEAAQLVLQAGAMGEGGEIFVLDMGEPVRIFDMAKDMIGLFGLKPFDDIDIVFTGMRPGEKLFEELETEGEHIARTRHPKIFIGTIQTYDDRAVTAALARFEELSKLGRERELRSFFNEFLPEARVATFERSNV
ncbi:MAG TPA: nucleoside-diphosphate sugar epimerase/dehydratase [Candidatus Sulfomarinibacteraceae bacterium]|nr:nucleoside-diphosphate sugar epimerase/dehydratase [Candidatus Sulfomarinibacteraceae bacterium]